MIIVLKVVYLVIILHYKVAQVAEKIQSHLNIILIFLVLVVIHIAYRVNMWIGHKKINVTAVQSNAVNVLEEVKMNVNLVI